MNAMQLAVSNLLRHKPNTETRICMICGMSFDPAGLKKSARMCSDVCREQHKTNVQMEKRAKAKLAPKCEHCGKTFTPSALHPHQRFCSEGCQRRAARAAISAKLKAKQATRTCPTCGTQFSTNQPHKVNCSLACSKKYHRLSCKERARATVNNHASR